MMNKCPDENTLIEYLDRELSSEKDTLIKEHLADCRKCQHLLSEFNAVFTELPALKELPFSADFNTQIMSRLQPAPVKQSTLSSFLHNWSYQLTGAMVATILISLQIQPRREVTLDQVLTSDLKYQSSYSLFDNFYIPTSTSEMEEL